ncbi:hypothetical protein SAMN05421743_101191 [Thalassobacillus cyri]|uniref:Uncharacterized protein n=1 Tax=Thalassobacillus cyri TaxID=571932 RepID=A0A1H3VUQ9_9BACI|nr:hypothetical protein [Thalassobacillus cyri]SDZ78517.1 hypothetical protein SAMN05421743_101191 [Thalassobacillus cyri]
MYDYYNPYQPVGYSYRQQNGGQGQGPMVCFPEGSAPQIEGGLEGTVTVNDEEVTVTCYPVPAQGMGGGPQGQPDGQGQENGQGNGNGQQNGGQPDIPYGDILEQLPLPGQGGNGQGGGMPGGMMPQLPFPEQGGNGQGGTSGFPFPGQGNGQGGIPGGGMMPGLPGQNQGQQGGRFASRQIPSPLHYTEIPYYW